MTSLGAFGEAWAVGYLNRQGFRIRERNVRFRSGEIDIVAQEGICLVFVEVKTRRTGAFGSPQESVTPARFQRLARTIAAYIDRHGLDGQEYRIDVLALFVDAGGRVYKHEHLRNVAAPDP
jgi:putative endonuclease